MSDPSPSREKIIKRYSNRKLYDTADSRYVTLEEIGEMVKQGVEVKVIDNKSKEDLTNVTLAQIVFEEEKKSKRLSLQALKEIIRKPSETVSDFIRQELSPRVQSIREEAEQRIDKLWKRDEGSNDIFTNSKRALEEWRDKIDGRVKTGVDQLMNNLPALGKDISVLLERIDSLEKKVAELEAEKKEKN